MNHGLRFRILTRDGFACRYCGARPPDVVLQVDHIQPLSRGGSDRWENLITACWPCNSGKRARLLSPELIAILEIAPETVPPPRRVRITPPRTRAARVLKRAPAIPMGLGSRFPYIGPDQPAPQWVCSRCGFLCGLGSDVCSCARPTVVVRTCWECAESDADLDDDGLCLSCSGLCFECRDEPRVDGEDYCLVCEAEMAVNRAL